MDAQKNELVRTYIDHSGLIWAYLHCNPMINNFRTVVKTVLLLPSTFVHPFPLRIMNPYSPLILTRSICNVVKLQILHIHVYLIDSRMNYDKTIKFPSKMGK